MEKRIFALVSIVATVALVTAAGLGLAVGGDGAIGQGSGLLHRLHGLGNHLHGGGHHGDPMGQLIEELKLTPAQQQQVEKIQQLMSAHHGRGAEPMAALHEQFVEQLREGDLDADRVKQSIDAQIDRMRETAYSLTDELVELVNGLDAEQRETLLNHFRQAERSGHGHGH